MRYATADDKHARAVYFLSRTIKQPSPVHATPCMLWQGSTSNGNPNAGVRGKQVSVRRYVYAALCGGAPGYLKAECAQPLCINPAHQT